MRVLHVIGQLVPGGSEKMTLQLAEASRGHGDEHRVFSFGEVDRHFVASLGVESVPIHEAGGLDRGVAASAVGMRRLVRLVREHRPDVLQGHAWRSSIAVGLVGAATKIPALATLHRVYYPRLEAVIDRGAQRLWRAVVVDSDAVKAMLERRVGFDGGRVTVIPNFVASRYFEIPPPDEGRAEIRILMAAHFSEVKGHRFALLALDELNREQPGRFHLDLLGEGPLRETCKQLARELGLESVVHFHGRSHELETWLSNCDIVVLPSLWEGFGMILAEAMASGRPAVSFAIGGAMEVVADGETGFLVPPADTAALAAALRKLADEPELRSRFGREGREVARQRFAADRVVARYRQLYADVVQG